MTPSVDDAELLAFLQEWLAMPEEQPSDGFTSDASLSHAMSATNASQSISPKQRAVIQRPTAKRQSTGRKLQQQQQQLFMASSLGKMKKTPIANGERRKRVPIEKQRLYDRRAAEKKKVS